uniref:Uncharacterized protein n=1 Tax=Timema bartmani TaxID=61472 RepID=A0A7R9FAC4_9NEOP|nr:unnamed protein product [Timema bartmani]
MDVGKESYNCILIDVEEQETIIQEKQVVSIPNRYSNHDIPFTGTTLYCESDALNSTTTDTHQLSPGERMGKQSNSDIPYTGKTGSKGGV